MKKRILAAVLASASILGAVAGCSSNEGGANDEWPSQTVKIIVPFAAGGSTDMTFRFSS